MVYGCKEQSLKVGVAPAEEIKRISKESGLSVADALRGVVIEAFLEDVYSSGFQDVLWLKNSNAIGKDAYGQKQENGLQFYYVESEKAIPEEKRIPGQKLSEALMEEAWKNIFAINKDEVQFEAQMLTKDARSWCLTARYQEMQVPVSVELIPMFKKELYPKKIELRKLRNDNKVIAIHTHSQEYCLAEHFFEIIDKLELIPDMKHYWEANDILKKDSVSGRHVMEILESRMEGASRIRRYKRIEQIKGYSEYAYMRKRWEQYEKAHKTQKEPWSEVLDRILAFGEPVWKAICENEIFFDDWMPELGRFLG